MSDNTNLASKEAIKILEGKETVSEITKLNAALDLLTSAEANMNAFFTGMGKIINTAKKTLVHLEKEKDDLEKIKQEQEQQISGLTQEQQQLLKEYEQVKEELEKFTRMATQEGDIRLEDMKATLAIYRILLEQIWQSQPHFKVLFLLHGDKEEMNVEELKNSSGVSGAMILRACHDLARAKLIEFDIETKKAKLLKRLFPKKKKQ